ncbi:hypothetical protein CULC809_01142 [Corynebacterium ulcerans 809]|nr:hypothetical protein CULC809_01142 [Corynebacterium ulcerans 809]
MLCLAFTIPLLFLKINVIITGMKHEEAIALEKAWNKKGNPPCNHPHFRKEIYLGSKTGDEVCTTCGYARPRQLKH